MLSDENIPTLSANPETSAGSATADGSRPNASEQSSSASVSSPSTSVSPSSAAGAASAANEGGDPGASPSSGAYTIEVGRESRSLTQEQLLEAAKVGLERVGELKSLEPLIELQHRISKDAQVRDALAVALRAAGVSDDIVQRLGVSRPQSGPSTEDAAGSTLDAALMHRLETLEAMVKSQAEERAIAELKARYGEAAVDAEQLKAKAKELGISDLAAVYKIITYDAVAERAVQEYIAGKRRPGVASPLPVGAPAHAGRSFEPPTTFRQARELATQRLREVNAT